MDKADEILNSGRSLIVITGPRGCGKTILAGTFLRPSQIGRLYVHDAEHSWNNMSAQFGQLGLRIGHYVNLPDRFNNLPTDDDLLNRITDGRLPWVDPKTHTSLLEYYHFILNDLRANLTPGKFDVYVLDTIKYFEAAMAVWAEKNTLKAGVTGAGWGKIWSEGIFPLYEGFINSLYARGIKTVILTAHLRTPWEGNRQIVGKVTLSGKKVLQFLSRLMIWLERDSRNSDKAPAGLVLKERLGEINFDAVRDEWRIQTCLPPRIPHCTWEDIRHYIAEGYNTAQPDPREILSKEEEELISDAITDKQMELMLLDTRRAIQDNLLQMQQESVPILPSSPRPLPIDGNDPLVKHIQALLGQGLVEPAAVRAQLNKEDSDLSLPQVIKIMRAIQSQGRHE